MFSNYTETTALRLNGVYPEDELRTLPLLASRMTQGSAALQKGHIIIPDLLANGMGVKLGDTVVVIATNRDGSVNAALVMSTMRRMRDSLKTTFVFSTPDPRVMAEAEIVFRLEDGRLVGREIAGAAA